MRPSSCIVCNKAITQGRVGRRYYCSKKCMRSNLNPKPENRMCKNCGKEYNRTGVMIRTKFCSPECSKDAYHKAYVKRMYGVENYSELLALQDGKCKICSSTSTQSSKHKKFSVDHNHKTGDVRGLLCAPCNHGLGKFKDNPTLMIQAAEYICSTMTLQELITEASK